MENYLPLFPLNLVAFPNEALNLHIFEPRYKQLIKDTITAKTFFGIPSFVNKKIEYGTEMAIVKVEKEYEDGRLDIMTEGRRIFKVLDFVNPLPNKLYAGGKVEYIESINISDYSTQMEMVNLIKELYESLNLKEIVISDDIQSFDIAHKIGLSQEDEYVLLKINNELERQQFLIDHLQKAIPMIRNIERTKEKIKMNGHFKFMDPLNF